MRGWMAHKRHIQSAAVASEKQKALRLLQRARAQSDRLSEQGCRVLVVVPGPFLYIYMHWIKPSVVVKSAAVVGPEKRPTSVHNILLSKIMIVE